MVHNVRDMYVVRKQTISLLGFLFPVVSPCLSQLGTVFSFAHVKVSLKYIIGFNLIVLFRTNNLLMRQV